MKRIVRLTESDLARIVRRVISETEEESQNMLLDKNWLTISSGLKSVTDSSGNMPKIINWTDEEGNQQSLNWGNKSEAGKKKKWGLSLSTYNHNLEFATEDEATSEIYENLTDRTCSKSGPYYTDELPLNYSIPNTVISTVKKIVKGMG